MVVYKAVSSNNFVFEYSNVGPHLQGSWHKANKSGSKDWRPVIRCLECGGLVSLDKNHVINDMGRVSPSIGCPWCGWHVFGSLDRWQEQIKE